MLRSHDWHARWVGGSKADSSGFARSLFRSTFSLPELPADAGEIRVSADAHYVLFLNGVEIGRGPERAQPRRKTHDLVAVSAEMMRRGDNTLTCVVTFYDASNAIWQAATPSGALGSRAALLLDGRVGGLQLGEVLTWRTRRSTAYRRLPGEPLEGVPSIEFDARLFDPEWSSTTFDDSGWEPAEEVGAGHRLYVGCGTPPVAPFGRVPERTSPLLTDVRKDPVVRSRTAPPPSPDLDRHPAVLAGRMADLDFSDALETPAVDLRENEVGVIQLDFGGVVSGILEFEVEAPEGTRVDVAFLDSRDGFDDGPLASRNGATYIARGHHDSFGTIERYGMSTALVLISPPAGFSGTVRLGDPHLRERIRPWTATTPFDSDDDTLAALWNAGIRTTALNTVDGFTDCPTREQRAWVGDGVVHAGVHLVANGDWGAVREYLVQADSPRDDGILPMSVAGDLEARGGVTIPSWSLHWIHALHEYFLHAGVDEVADRLPTARRILHWFATRQNDDGVLGRTGEWDLVDWSSVYVADQSAALTALWGRGLNEYARMSDAAGDSRSARWARTHATRAAQAFERFWDPLRGLYVDYLAPGTTLRDIPVSQVTNASAVEAGFVPDARLDGVVERIAAPENLVVSSFYASADGRVDLARWEAISAGERIIDWDEAAVIRAEPFLSTVVHDAYRTAGRHDLVLRAIRDWSGFLEGGRDTFGETWMWGTSCHGWSSTPTRDIARSLLGISPTSPGYATARIAPRTGIANARGGVPTPHGPIEVAITDDTVTVTSPVPFQFVSSHSSMTLDMAPGTYRLDSRSAAHAVAAGQDEA